MIAVGIMVMPVAPGMKITSGLTMVGMTTVGMIQVIAGATVGMKIDKGCTSNSLDLSDLKNAFVEDTTVEGEGPT